MEPPSSRQDWMPLSPFQELAWADSQLFPESRRFHHCLWFSFTGEQDVFRLERAWRSVLGAHEAFRIFVDTLEPRQCFGDSLPASAFSVEKFTVTGESDQAVQDWFLARRSAGLDLTTAPWALSLSAGPTGLHSCFLVHSLICDEASLRLVYQQVVSCWNGAVSVPAIPLRPRLETLASSVSSESPWGRVLASPPPSAVLLDRPPTERSGRMAALELVLDLKLGRGLQDLALQSSFAAEGLDLVLTTSAFAWINRLMGQSDLIMATLVDPRGAGEESLVGPLERRSFLRVEVEDHDTFRSLLAKTAAARKFAAEHPLDTLGADFESAFVSRFTHSEAFQIISDQGAAPGVPVLRWTEDGPSVRLKFEFPEEVFTPDDRSRYAGYFLRVLEALVDSLDESVHHPELVGPEESSALLAQGQGLRTEPAKDLLAMIAAQTALRPEAPAVEFRGRTVSYGQLDRLTNRLARRLQNLGVETGSRVAVAQPRGFGEFMGIIAVLKAGAAYVPVDPTHPVDRVRVILEDAMPQVLIRPRETPLADALPKGVPSLVLDDPLSEAAEVEDSPLDLPVDPRQRAYIIFTSGSTGRPKGVEIPRGGISNFLQSVAKKLGLGVQDRLCAISTTTFDMSELDFFLPLCTGGTVIIAERVHALDPVQLRSLLEERKATALQATPTTWRMLLDAGWKGHDGFRIFTGGEPISPALAQRLLDCCGELWNLYGPTETSVYSTIHRITKDDEKITVGRAIDNTLITIRDAESRLVPRYAIGEICIGGAGLALGYFGRPDLTADRFPLDPRTGERHYRTGDLGRWQPDGRLECLGRVDFQVKVRGFRIEPADIEAQLRSVPGLREVLVTALHRGEGDPQLVAYWVGDASKEALVERAKSTLPHYMVPSAWVHLEAFPTNTSGKVDRKRLPAPEQQPPDASAGTPPRNDRESLMAAVWREVLGLSFVPVDEDFFSLGGSSVRVIQLRGKLKTAFGIEYPLKVLFDHPTVEKLATWLDYGQTDDSPVVSRLAQGADPVPWFGLMGIQLFDDLALALAGPYSTMAIHVPINHRSGLDPFPTVASIAERYVEVLRAQQPEGPYWLFGLCHGGIVAFEAAAQLEDAGQVVGMVVLFDAELPLARRTLKTVRFQHLMKRTFSNPAALALKALSRLSRVIRPAGVLEEGPPVLDEAGIDGDLLRYQGLGRKVSCEVMTFRALKGDTVTPWSVVSPDLGWTGRAKAVRSHDLPSTHLGIVRAPHATLAAGLMSAAREEISKELGLH